MAILGVCAIMACHARRGVTMHSARAAACQCVPMHPGGSVRYRARGHLCYNIARTP